MSITPVRQKSTPESLGRARFWVVILPVILAGILILVAVAVLFTTASAKGEEEEQLSIIGNVMLICFVLCPMVLCGMVFHGILVAASFGLDRLHSRTARSVKRAEHTTRKLVDKTYQVSDTLNRKAVGFSTRFAFLGHLLEDTESDLEQPESDAEDESRD